MNDNRDPSRRPRRRWLRWSLIGLLVIVVSGAVTVSIFAFSLMSDIQENVKSLSQDEAFPSRTASPNGPDGSQNILLMGSDSRASTDDFADMKGNRSDTIMVANIPADGNAVTVMSIMRDSWVPIRGHGHGKINAAISWGGVPLAVETVESMIGAEIDHVMIVDFEGFKALTDSLGGVRLYNEKAFTSQQPPRPEFAKGMITVDSENCLAYIRERYAFPDGDHQRVRNQQQFVKGVFASMLDKGTLTDPFKMRKVIDQTTPYLTVDDGFTVSSMIDLGTMLGKTRQENIRFFTAPTAGPDMINGQSVVTVDWDEMAKVKASYAQDSVADYAKERR